MIMNLVGTDKKLLIKALLKTEATPSIAFIPLVTSFALD